MVNTQAILQYYSSDASVLVLSSLGCPFIWESIRFWSKYMIQLLIQVSELHIGSAKSICLHNAGFSLDRSLTQAQECLFHRKNELDASISARTKRTKCTKIDNKQRPESVTLNNYAGYHRRARIPLFFTVVTNLSGFLLCDFIDQLAITCNTEATQNSPLTCKSVATSPFKFHISLVATSM